MRRRFFAVVIPIIILFSLITVSANAKSLRYDANTWYPRAAYTYNDIVTPIGVSAAAVVQGKIYVFGNANWDGYPNSKNWVNVYDPVTDLWSPREPMPENVFVRVAVVDDIIYVFGAYKVDPNISDSLVKSVYKYDPALDSWLQLNDNDNARMISSVAALNGKIYVMGGQSEYGAYSNSIEAYDPATGTWQTNLAPMPTARSWIEAISADGKIYAVGGWNGTGVTTVDVYDPQLDVWTSAQDIPVTMWDTGYNIVEKNGKIYLVGGCTGVTCNMFPQVYVYDIANNIWSPLDGEPSDIQDYPIARSGGITTLVNNTIYSFGGYSYGTFYSEGYAMDLSDTTPDPTYTPTFTPVPSATFTPTPTLAPTPAYVFTGFFPPVDNLPIINIVKAGSAIPVKFSLGSDFGLNIFLSGFPASSLSACGSTAEDAIEQTVTASASGLQYDAVTNQYVYVWKTEKSWGGTCRTLVLKFSDGSTQKANFKFK